MDGLQISGADPGSGLDDGIKSSGARPGLSGCGPEDGLTGGSARAGSGSDCEASCGPKDGGSGHKDCDPEAILKGSEEGFAVVELKDGGAVKAGANDGDRMK